jgi:glycosyltransferase involved in cell wall biosynthesis
MMLSIIIPSYQHADYVVSCIAAAVAIPVEEKEIIVIDDGSWDGSPRLIQKWINENSIDSCVRMIAHENRGLVSVLNEGLAIAKGLYIYIVASDDVPISTGISTLIERLNKKQSAKFAMGNARAFKGNLGDSMHSWITYGAKHENFLKLSPKKRLSEIFLNYPVPLLIQATVFKRECLIDIGGWDSNLTWDDYPLFVKLFKAYPALEIDFIYSPEVPVVNYRQHDNNSYRDLEKQVSMIVQALEALCPNAVRPNAVARVYMRFAMAALRKFEFSKAQNFVRRSLNDFGSIATVRQAFLALMHLIYDKFLSLRSTLFNDLR